MQQKWRKIGEVVWGTGNGGITGSRTYSLYLNEDNSRFMHIRGDITRVVRMNGRDIRKLDEYLTPSFYRVVKPFIDNALEPDPSVSPNARRIS